MATPNDLLSQAIAASQKQIQTNAANAQDMIRAAMAGGYADAARSDAGVPRQGNAPAAVPTNMDDIRGMYFSTMGNQAYTRDRTSQRTNAQGINDTALSIANGAIQSTLGLGALGLGLLNNRAGEWAANGLDAINNGVMGLQSDGLNNRRRANAASGEQITAYNKQSYDEDVKTDGSFLAGLKRIGRDGYGAVSNALSDGTIAGDGLANGLGSLLSAGPLAKGLGTIGKAVLRGATEAGLVGEAGAATAMRLGQKASMPATIGAQESGGTYQQTYVEALRQLEGRTDLTDDQKRSMANSAALEAAAIQFPTAAVTGAIVGQFERMPFRVPNMASGAGNLLKETIEEAIQGGTSQFATNRAIKDNVNSEQDLLDGIGEQVGLGGLYGLGAAGVVQAPGMAARTGLLAARAGINLGAKAVKGTIGAVTNAVDARLGQIDTSIEAKSPTSSQRLSAVNEKLNAEAPVRAEAVAQAVAANPTMAPEVKQQVMDNFDVVQQAFAVNPVEVESAPDNLKPIFDGAKNRFDTFQNASKIIQDKSLDPMVRAKAAQYLLNGLTTIEDHINEVIAPFDDNDPVMDVVNGYLDQVNQINSNNNVRAAVQELVPIIQSFTAEQVQNDKDAAQTVADIAGDNVGDVDADVAKAIFYHADNGDITLKPRVRESLEMVVAADDAHKASQFSPIVNTDRHRVTGEISDNPGANAQGQFSIKGHITAIQSALRKGDIGAAEMQARDLVRFSDHMQNKVAALNESWDIVPGGEKPNAVPFEAYNPKTKLGYKAKAFLNPRSNSSIELGNIIGMNAQEVGTVAQIIAKAHPEWNLNPKPVVPLRQEARQAQAEIFERSTASEKAARRQAEAALTPEQTVASTKRNSDPAPKAAPVTAESVVRESETARTDPSAVVRTSVRQSEDQAKPVSQQTNPVAKTGQSEVAPQSQEVSEDAPASQEPDARKQPTKEAEEEVQVVPQQQTEEVETDQAEASKEPSVIAAPNDRFDAAFGKPNPKRSRVADKANVVEWVRDALSDADAFARATDATKKSAKLTKETASAYAGMLSGVPRIIAAMNQQLLDKSKEEQGTGVKGVKVPFMEALESHRGNAILMYDENRALGILKENTDGKLEYDPRLVEQAVLAGMQWAIEGNAREGLLSAEKLGSILNMNEAQAQNYLARFNEGISFGDGASRLGNLIKNFWGVSSAKDVGIGLSNGIAEGVAKEVMRALDKVGLVHIPEPFVINNKNYSQVQFTLTKSVTEKMAKAMGEKGIEEAQRFIADLNGYPNAISDLVLTESVPTYSVGEPIKSNQTMQLRSSFAYLTAEQKQLIANEEASPRYPNAPLMNIYEAMGPTGAVALFGEPDVANMNKRHQESVESRNKQLRSAHEVLVNTKAQTTAYAEQQDGEGADYSTVPVYFPFTITASNRLQMESRFNPQSSKLVRDALPPTWSNIDMTDPKSYQGFMLGMAQAMGVKLNKARLAQNIAKAEDILARPGYQEVVDIIRGMLGASTSEVALSFTPEMAKRIRNLLGNGKALEPVQFGALVEYARYLEAKEEGDEALKDFNTMAFVEADGITDGPGNAIKHFEAGNFTREWADNMARTGGFVGRQDMTINQFNVQDVAANNRGDALDLYGKMSGRLNAFVQKQHSKIVAQVGGEQIKAIQTLLYTLLPNQVKLVDGALIFDRNFVKNPLTVDTYGSGAKGIAGKIVNDLATALYENETKLLRAQAEQGDKFDPAKAMFGDVPNAQANYDAFRAAMKTASNTNVYVNGRGQFAVGKPDGRIFRGSHLDPNFSLEEGALDALTSNVQHIYVTPMIEAMNTVMGPAKDTIATIRSLSQIHSSALGYAFFNKINEIVKGKTKAYKEGGEYFSSNMYATPAEIDSVMKSLAPLQPTLRTGTQQIAYAGNERAKTGVSYSRSLDRQNATDGLIPALTQAGVRVVALLTQAIGDGQMIQNIGTMKGAPQGTEKVFDGVHLKMSTLTEDGAKVNQAVYDAWMRTPVTDMLNSIKLFRDNMNWDFLQKESFTLNKKNPDPRVIDLMKTFAGLIWPDNYKKWEPIRAIAENGWIEADEKTLQGLEATIKKMALPVLDSLIGDLERRAGEIEIRNEVIKHFGMSVDHMAGVESAYTVKGEVDTTGMTDQQIVEAMQAEYEKRHDERFPPVVQEKEDTPLLRGEPTNVKGVSMLDAALLVNTIRAGINKDQRPLMTSALKVLRDNPGWQVLIGTREDLKAYAKDQGGMVPEGSFLGATVPSEKRIYVVESAGVETILHEVLHATTMDKLIQHYADPSQSSPEMTETVNRLEGLMADWMDATEDTSSLKQATQDAVLNAKRQILSALENGDQVRALNEFMAWNLSNKDLVRLNQGILAKLGQITKAALAAIKKLIFGGQQAVGVSDSVFDNLRFNTMAIMLNDQATLNGNPVAPVMFNMEVNENEESALSKGIHDTIIRLYAAYDKTTPKFENGKDGNRAWNEALIDLADGEAMAATVAANGYAMGPEEHSNFVRISALLSSEFAPANAMLNQSQKMYEQFLAKVTVDDFIKMGNDPLVARKKFNLLTGEVEQANQKNRKGLGSLMPNFFALAASNVEFQNELRQIALDEKETDTSGTLDAKLTNFGNDLMAKSDQMYSGLDGKETNMSEAMQKLVAAMFMSDASANSWLGMLEKATNAGDSVVERFDRMGSKYMGEAGEAAFAKGQKIIENANGSKVMEILGQGMSALGGVMDPAAAEMLGEEALRAAHGMQIMRPLREMMAEMVGRTQSNKGQFDLIKNIRQVVDTLRQQYREYLPDAFAKEFSRDLTNQEWNQLHKLGTVDSAALADHIGMPALIKMMKSGFSGLTGEINKAEREVIKLGGSQNVLTLATNLAQFMNGLDHSQELVRNAYAIAFLSNGNQEPDTKLVDAIDKLVSLRALDNMSQEDQSFLTEMTKTEEKGVTSLISYMKGQRNKENKRALSTEQKLNMFKGYVPTTPKEGVTVILRNDAEYTELTKLGYTRVGDFDKTLNKAFGGAYGYYVSNTGLKGSYLQGTMRTVHDTVGGINAVTLQNTQPTAAVATDPTDVHNVGKMNQMAMAKGSSYLAQPIYDNAGRIIRYEFPLPADMRAMLKEDRHLGKAIGQWSGRQAEEQLAHMMNEAVVEEAEKAYRAGPRGDFVNLFSKEAQKDPIIRDSMSLVPFAMRDLLEEKFGPNQFWVHKDMVNNVVGYRKASVRDQFTENTRLNAETQTFVKNTATLFFGAKAFEYLAKGEDLIKKGVSQAKQTIVIKSVVVPMANFAAAMLQLRATGVRTSSILKGVPAKLNEAHIYTKGLLKRMDLELQAQVADGEGNTAKAAALNKQIRVLEDGWRRLSIWPLLEAGELSSISDGALSKDDVDLTEGRFADYIEKLTDKMPDGVKTLAKYGLVTKDTALYKGLTRSVQFGDFVAKAVLYDHRIAEGKTPEQALGEVTEAFVNFEYQPGRTASYWDDMGLRWFWHFKLRSAKFALSMVRNTPVSALMSTFMPTVPLLGNIGTPVNDSIISQVFDGRAARSLGWATGMRSFFLNPWVNLVH